METEVPIKTTETMFEIVEVLLEQDGARFTSLIGELDMAESTLYDHLTTMESLGLLAKQDQVYRVSTELFDMGEKTRRQRRIYRAARDEVKRLAVETGEHATLMVEEAGEGVLLDVQKGENAVDINAYPGRHLPLSPHAPGKAILAYLPEDRVEEILDEHGLPKYTEQTTTDRDELWEELEQIREQGYAIDDEELITGVRAVAVPVRNRGQIWGTITIGGPTNRMQNEFFETDLLDSLMQATNIVELNLNVPS
ncbi:MAG: IclR family acetate operon transcriptional repressor [Natronomonas sp.]|jgi:IclR family acetate operon transcriptional repressor